MNEATSSASVDARPPSDNLSEGQLAARFSARRKARRSSMNAPVGAPPAAPASSADTPPAGTDTPPPQTPPATAPPEPSAAPPPAPAAPDSPPAPPAEPAAPPSEPAPAAPPGPSGEVPPELLALYEDAKARKNFADMAKRIHDLVDQRDAERNARLEAERRLATPPPADTPPPPADQQARLKQIDQLLDWCDENSDGGQLTDAKGNPVELDAAAVRKHRRQWEREYLELAADNRVSRFEQQQRQAAEQTRAVEAAVAKYPWMNNPQSSEYAEAMKVIAERPYLKGQPDAAMAIGEMVTARLGLAAARALTPPPPPRPNGNPAPLPGAAGAVAPSRSTPQKQLQDARAQFEKDGSAVNLAKFYAAQRAARRAAE